MTALLLHSLCIAGELAHLAGLACIHTVYHVVLLSQPDTGDTGPHFGALCSAGVTNASVNTCECVTVLAVTNLVLHVNAQARP